MTGAAEAVAAEKRLPRRRSRVLFFAGWVIVLGGAILILRAAPVLDPDVEELAGRITVIRSQFRNPVRDWEEQVRSVTRELRAIADEAGRAHRRLTGPWRWVAAPDKREEAALREIQRIAESDLPALIASGLKGNRLRERTVDDALARLDDHVAGASPYLPPLRPIENQAGLDRAERRNAWIWIVGIVMFDVLLLAAGVTWWRGRCSRGSVPRTQSGGFDSDVAAG